MNRTDKNSEKANATIKLKKSVWEITIEVNSRLLEKQYETNPETKVWKIKVILN